MRDYAKLALAFAPVALAAPRPFPDLGLSGRDHKTSARASISIPGTDFMSITCTNAGVTDAAMDPATRWADVKVVSLDQAPG